MSSFLDGHGFRCDDDGGTPDDYVKCDVCGYEWDGNAQCTMCVPDLEDSDAPLDDAPAGSPAPGAPVAPCEATARKPTSYGRLSGVLNGFKESKENRYAFQLLCYADILRRRYGLRPRLLLLVRLDPATATHQVLHVPHWCDEAEVLVGPVDALPAGSPLVDPNITFDEASHTYAVKGAGPVASSVTTVVGRCFPAFDPDNALAAMRRGKRWGPGHKHWGKTDDEIKAEWTSAGEAAAEAGSALHRRIDEVCKAWPAGEDDLPSWASRAGTKRARIASDRDAALEAVHRGFARFDRDMRRQGWRHLASEVPVVGSMRVAGSIDAVYASALDPKEVAVVDWKVTNKEFCAASFGRL